MAKKKKSVHTKAKTELGKKLFAVRKQMSKQLLGNWFNWAKMEKSDITEPIFVQLTRGDFISKDNVLFAIKALKEGKRMLIEFEARVEAEVASIDTHIQ